jgi:hypothetical protein
MFRQGTYISFWLVILLSVAGATSALADSPRPPDHCNATLGEIMGGVVMVVDWRDRSNNEDGFQVEHWTRIDGVWVLTETAQFGVNETRAIFLINARHHRFRVRAYNGDGESSWSNWARLNLH